MNQEIVRRLQKVTLMEEEEEEEEESTFLEEIDVYHGVEECLGSCVGRIFDTKEYSLCVLRTLLRKV